MRWKGLTDRKYFPGWIAFGLLGWLRLAIEVLDWWDRGQSILEKAQRGAPMIGPVLALLSSPWLHLGLAVFGIAYIAWASRASAVQTRKMPSLAESKLDEQNDPYFAAFRRFQRRADEHERLRRLSGEPDC